MELYTISVVGLGLIVVLGLWTLRFRIGQLLPTSLAARLHLRQYEPVQTFEGAAQGGFTSGTFDLHDNLEAGEARSGMDEAGLTEVRRIMDSHRVGFDEARLIRSQRIMRKNGIDPATGLPLDKKAITSLS